MSARIVSESVKTEQIGGRRAVAILGLLLALMTLVLFPAFLYSVVRELIVPPAVSRYVLVGTLPSGPPRAGQGPLDAAYIDVAVVSIDEPGGLLSLRVSANRACPTTCAAYTLLLFSLGDDVSGQLGLPPVARIELPGDASDIRQTVQLPIAGLPDRYPWDVYHFQLGATIETTRPDGTPVEVRRSDSSKDLLVTLQSQLRRLHMDHPVAIDPATVHVSTDPEALLFAQRLTFSRPLYLAVLTPLLITLSGAAAFYSVRMQPMQQLFTGSGSLVIGVWGVRSVLVPGSVTYTTAVDLLLSVVILILLGGITIRTSLFIMRNRAGNEPPP